MNIFSLVINELPPPVRERSHLTIPFRLYPGLEGQPSYDYPERNDRQHNVKPQYRAYQDEMAILTQHLKNVADFCGADKSSIEQFQRQILFAFQAVVVAPPSVD
jgi:hypothetical protein